MTLWPWSCSRQRLLRHLDSAAIEQAIARAEARSSGEIIVSVAGYFHGDLQRLAARAFHRLGMGATRQRNAVLILVAPTRRKFAILGDDGIHARVGDFFWTALRDGLERRFRGQEFSAGLIEAIDLIGAELATHFPPPLSGGDVNELPNTVDVARTDD